MNMKSWLFAVLAGTVSISVQAESLQLEIEIPKLNVAEYHRPYVAIWIEDERGQHKMDLAVWYDTELKNNEGTKWLKDLRLWWRRSGRELELPVDGLSGATKTVGSHVISFDEQDYHFSALPAGQYKLVVEAAREVGGRELVKLPFNLPIQLTTKTNTQGQHELGDIVLKQIP